ncbi:MAG: LysR family transcriptional regulator [Myxococcales bacterium]|nr:LysR family transcriptional regulator [Myxococcales bacterium]
MKAFLELSKVWSWLPHFRVVAEYESLSRASRRFGISSAALSKAVRTLEKGLGVELFDRAGGKLRLNARGRALLEVIRNDMRDLDDVITAIRSTRAPDFVRVAMDPAWAGVLVPPGTGVELVDAPAAVSRALLRGEADVVLHGEPVASPELDTVPVGAFARAICTASEDEPRGFAAIVIRGAIADGWPVERTRDVAVVTHSLAHAAAVVTQGMLAAVLPIAIARAFRLRIVDTPDLVLPPCPMYATTRRARGGDSAPLRWRDRACTHAAAHLR